MKIYNFIGYSIIFSYLLACMYFAPAHLGPWTGLAIGGSLLCLFLVSRRRVPGRCSSFGNCPSFARLQRMVHKARHAREQLLRALCRSGRLGEPPSACITSIRTIPGIPINLPAMVSGERCISASFRIHAMRIWPPTKFSSPGHSGSLRTTVSRCFHRFSVFALLWLLVRDLKFALVMWVGLRIFALWVNMIQNYWTHTRTYRIPALRRRARQRDEHRRVAAGHRDLQRLPAEQPSPLPGSFAAEPRRIRIRLWICHRQGHEGSGPGPGDGKGRRICPRTFR